MTSSAGNPKPRTTVHYRERLTVPPHWWGLGIGLVASLWLALVVAIPGWVAGFVTLLALLLLIAVLTTIGKPEIVVTEQGLSVGRASITWQYVGDVQPLDRTQTTQILGPQADARAYLAIRGYLPTAVRIEVADARDPHPYWVVSTRHPQALCEAVRQARSAIR